MTSTQAQRTGMLAFTLFVGCILLSLHLGLLTEFLLASVFAGIAQGLVLTGSIGTMVTGLKAEERANVFSVIYASSYVGAAIPTLIAGRLSNHLNLLKIAYGYGMLALCGSVVVLVKYLRSTPNDSAKPKLTKHETKTNTDLSEIWRDCMGLGGILA